MSCKPKDFYGNDGAIGLLRWLDKIQAVLRISDCLETHKVRYAANSFQGKALNWWNNQIQARGIDEAESMEWEEFKALLLEEYCPINELQKLENEFWHLTMKGADLMAYNDRFHELSSLLPHMVNSEARKIERYIWGLAPQIGSMVTASRPTTLKSAILLAGQLRDHLVRTNAFENKNSGEKRKLDNPNTSNHSNHTNQTNHSNHFKKPNNNKKPATVRNYGAVNQERKNQHAPKCAKCNFFHFGTCLVCTKCGKPGHQANNCRSNPTPRACYGYDKPNKDNHANVDVTRMEGFIRLMVCFCPHVHATVNGHTNGVPIRLNRRLSPSPLPFSNSRQVQAFPSFSDRFGSKGKLAPRYVEPFEITQRIGPVAYRLRLPDELRGEHVVFHVSNLKNCLADESLVIPLEEIKVDEQPHFIEEPVEIMDREVKRMK
ncbi:hypothetical protein E3N88_38877 [Mikania micrantha]|uniref:CCHC-type domain-containing protein n=1 Tax=Mikania micrantha TaxID=192012 RepID=A0A5N6LVE5_9ASTR|nr:hypothetical protein E3N88_38877 [Mikania micrantha]